MRAHLLWILVLLPSMLSSSAEELHEKPLMKAPGVLLTFDDTHVAQWESALPLLEKYEARVTFFVTRFDQLSPEQRAGLQRIKAAGHAIGCHGLRHLKAAEYVKEHGLDEYIAQEVAPAVSAMTEAGFVPTSFAYPSSNNDAVTDTALLKRFQYLRSGTGAKEGQRYAQLDVLFSALDAPGKQGLLIGKGIDRIGYPENEALLTQLFEAMERASHNKEVLTLYAHNIAESSPSHHIKPATLEKILAHGQSLGLRFYSFEELPVRHLNPAGNE